MASIRGGADVSFRAASISAEREERVAAAASRAARCISAPTWIVKYRAFDRLAVILVVSTWYLIAATISAIVGLVPVLIGWILASRQGMHQRALPTSLAMPERAQGQ